MSNILTYRLLENANLKQSKEQVIKATISDLRYNLTKEQLKKIFSNLSSSSTNTLPLPREVTVKTGKTNQLECDSDSDTEDLLYTKSGSYKDLHFTKSPHYAKKKNYQTQLHQRPPKGKNPLDSKGNITRCSLCESINHWAPDFRDKTDSPNDTWLSYEAILFQTDFDHPSELKVLLSESWNAAVLDSGASKTVCR